MLLIRRMNEGLVPHRETSLLAIVAFLIHSRIPNLQTN